MLHKLCNDKGETMQQENCPTNRDYNKNYPFRDGKSRAYLATDEIGKLNAMVYHHNKKS
jgi:hypothetical protein